MTAYAQMRRTESALLAPQIKSWLLADRYVHERYAGVPYAQLHNARLACGGRSRDALGSGISC